MLHGSRHGDLMLSSMLQRDLNHGRLVHAIPVARLHNRLTRALARGAGNRNASQDRQLDRSVVGNCGFDPSDVARAQAGGQDHFHLVARIEFGWSQPRHGG